MFDYVHITDKNCWQVPLVHQDRSGFNIVSKLFAYPAVVTEWAEAHKSNSSRGTQKVPGSNPRLGYI